MQSVEPLICITLNARGLGNPRKRESLISWIKSHDPHVLLLQETKLNENTAITLLNDLTTNLPQYKYWHQHYLNSGNTTMRGLLAIIKKNIKWKPLTSPDDSLQIFKIYNSINLKSIYVANFYGTPYANKNNWFRGLPKIQEPYILGGDWNINPESASLKTKNIIHEWLGGNSEFSSTALSPDEWTWRNSNSKSLIDHFATTMPNHYKSYSILNPPYIDGVPITDHRAVKITISTTNNTKTSPAIRILFDFDTEFAVRRWMVDLWKNTKVFQTWNDYQAFTNDIKTRFTLHRQFHPIANIKLKDLEDEKIRKKTKLYQYDEIPNSYYSRRMNAQKNSKFANSKDIPLPTVKEYYETLFSVPPSNIKGFKNFKINKRLSHSNLLTKEILHTEIEQAIKNLSLRKAPGNDGIPNEVFKCAPFFAARKLAPLYNNWLKKGLDNNMEIKEGLMTLFFKDGDRSDPKNYRPITLLNTGYKIFATIITNRVIKLKSTLFKQSQKGFIPGRMTLDNILNCKLAQEMGARLAFLDFNKAFDSLWHKMISKSMKWLGFQPNFIELIKSMLGGFTKIKCGKEISNAFYCYKGVRQGDPLSPLLFALALEPLLEHLNKHNTFALGKTNTGALAFADDIALLAKDIFGLEKLSKTVTEFSKYSGLTLNNKKSILLGVKQEVTDPNSTLAKFSFATEAKYLGAYLNHTPHKSTGIHSTPWNKFIEKTKEWQGFFKGSGISTTGRARLVNSYLTSVLCYQLFFDTPSSLQNSTFSRSLTKMISKTNISPREEIWRAPNYKGGLGFFPLDELSQMYKAWWIDRWSKRNKRKQAEIPEWMLLFDQTEDFHKLNSTKSFVDSWTTLTNTATTTIPPHKTRPHKFIKASKIIRGNIITQLSSAQRLLDLNDSSIWGRVAQLRVRSKIKGFLWDLYHARLGIFRDYTCPFCKEGTSGNHLIRCTWIKNVLNALILLKHPNFIPKTHPLQLNFDCETNTEIAHLIWSIYKTFNLNIKLNTPDNWATLSAQRQKEYLTHIQKKQQTKTEDIHTVYKATKRNKKEFG